MSARVRGVVVPVLAVASLALAACGAGGSAGGPTGLATAGPVVSATTDPTGSSEPESAAPDVAPAAMSARLEIGGDVVALGTLGSWALDGSGSDTPWIPSPALTPIEIVRGSSLAVRFGTAIPIGPWQALGAAAADRTGQAPFGLGAREGGPPVALVPVDDLPSGDWVLSVRLFRADGRGDGTFYWFVQVR